MGSLLEKTPLISFILGPAVGLLVMSGRISPACTSDVTTAYSLLAGTVITVAGLFIGAIHHTEIQKNTKTTQIDVSTSTPQVTPQP